MIHEPGETMPSDYLSRHPVKVSNQKSHENIKETELFVNSILKASETDALTIKEMQQETKNEPEMQQLIQAVKRKTIENQSNLTEYKEVFKELSVHNDLVVRGHKIVVHTR